MVAGGIHERRQRVTGMTTRWLLWLRVTACGGVLLAGSILLAAGCTSSSSQATEPRGTAIVVFVDFSSSVRKADLALFEQELTTQIIPSLSAGDRILIAPITDRTLTEFRPLVDVSLAAKPQFNGWLDNVLRYNREVKDVESHVIQMKDKLRTQVAEVFARPHSSPHTDIFSSLILANKVFYNESRRKVLVLMSDMVEDSPPYRFETVAWNPPTNQKLLADLDAKGLIPDLSGVCVYVSGASAKNAEVAESIGHFWVTYFQQAHADMDPSRYAHVLLHWPPAKGCSVD
jgi:hypothetical protein